MHFFLYTKFSLNKIENGSRERVEKSINGSSTRGENPTPEADFSCPLNKKKNRSVKSNILMGCHGTGSEWGLFISAFYFRLYIYCSTHLFFVLLACCFSSLDF